MKRSIYFLFALIVSVTAVGMTSLYTIDDDVGVVGLDVTSFDVGIVAVSDMEDVNVYTMQVGAQLTLFINTNEAVLPNYTALTIQKVKRPVQNRGMRWSFRRNPNHLIQGFGFKLKVDSFVSITGTSGGLAYL